MIGVKRFGAGSVIVGALCGLAHAAPSTLDLVQPVMEAAAQPGQAPGEEFDAAASARDEQASQVYSGAFTEADVVLGLGAEVRTAELFGAASRGTSSGGDAIEQVALAAEPGSRVEHGAADAAAASEAGYGTVAPGSARVNFGDYDFSSGTASSKRLLAAFAFLLVVGGVLALWLARRHRSVRKRPRRRY